MNIPSGWTIGVSIAVFIVWMQRHGRWNKLYRAMSGEVVLKTSPKAAQ